LNKKLFSALILIILLAFTLAACTPKDAKSAESKMKSAGYAVIVQDATEYSDDPEADGVDKGIMAINPVDSEYLIAIWFTSRTAAKKSFEYYRDSIEVEFEKKGLTINAVLSGKCIYIGTKQAIRDFKK